MASNKFNVGDLVWVSRSPSPNAAPRLQQVDEEAGVILKLGCALSPSSNQTNFVPANDGIMVKLQVSKIRGIFPASRLRPLEKKDDGGSCVSTPSAGSSRRRTARSCVTPSPSAGVERNDNAAGAEATKETQSKRKQPVFDADDMPLAFLSKKKRKSTPPGSRSTQEVHNEAARKPAMKVSPDSASKAKRAAQTEKRVSPKSSSNGTGDRKKAKSSPKLIVASESSSDADSDRNDESTRRDGSDSEDGDERPNMMFRVEYAPTGRATCRTCDMRIDKDDIRVCHRPLFRGKPGFVVYRHLHCATFDDSVDTKEDIGGWRRLKKADQEALRDRVDVAKAIVEQEQLELHPDELVQVSFQGEIRKPPKGLNATLLPFQVEGASWMYCQEIKAPVIRGGIMADEMGMYVQTFQLVACFLLTNHSN